MKCINLGSGKHPIKHFINYDICTYKMVHYLDVTKKFPKEIYNSDYIYSSHLIEHLTYDEFKHYLAEVYKCLKVGGVHRICFPSLDRIQDMLNNKEQYQEYFTNTFKKFNETIAKDFDLENYNPYCFAINNLYTKWKHKYIYDVNTVIQLCEQMNFRNITEKQLNDSDIDVFKNIESQNPEYEMFKKYESSVIECVK